MPFRRDAGRILIAAARAAAVVAASAAPAPAQDPAPAPQETRISDSVKQRPTVTNDSDMAARVNNEPLDPSLKGFLTIPGTDTRIRLTGYARLDVLHDFSPIGSTDDFIVATIPTDVETTADNTRLHARQTRFNLELRRISPRGTLRFVFENDFFGSSGERGFNLRHAYGQVANVLAGFTVSTLADPDARPDTLDYEGPPARVSARHAQLRYTVALPAKQSFAMAIEDPKSDIASTFDNQPITPRTPWPDFVARYRLDVRRGHLQVGSVYRSVGGFAGTGAANDQVFGVGVVTSGSLLIRGNHLVFESTIGRGVARYVKDTSGQGLDAAPDGAGSLSAIPVTGALAGVQHQWPHGFRSTIAGSIVRVRNEATQPPDTYHLSRYLAANLIHQSDTGLTVGLEVDYGELTVQDSARGSTVRAQFAVQYALVK